MELEYADFCGENCSTPDAPMGIYRCVGLGYATFLACRECLNGIKVGGGEILYEDVEGFVMRDPQGTLHVGFFSTDEEAWEKWVERVNTALAHS